MAKHSLRIGMFSTHRGRVVRNVLIAVGTASFLGLLVSGAKSPPADPDAYEAAVVMEEAPKGSGVAAPIAEPFAVQAAVIDDGLAANDGSKDAADAEEKRKKLLESAEYQSAVGLVQKVAGAYGTFSADTPPDEWVDSIPSLSPELDAALREEAAEQWVPLKDREESAVATPSAQSVKLVRAESGGTKLILAVTVTQDRTVDGVKGVTVASYQVTVEAQEGGAWLVTDIR